MYSLLVNAMSFGTMLWRPSGANLLMMRGSLVLGFGAYPLFVPQSPEPLFTGKEKPSELHSF